MRTLAATDSRWADDDGRADPALRAVLAAVQDTTTYLDAVVALGGARLLLAVQASGDEGRVPDPTRHAELAVALVEAPSGARAIPVFSGVDALQGWNPDARPLPTTLDQVASAAIELGAEAILIDPAGPAYIELGADVVRESASGRRLVRLDGGFGWASLA